MKYILVTGANGGMGKSTVELLRHKGYGIFAMDIKTEEVTEGVIPLRSDLRDPESIKAAFDKVKEITNELYAIIHFAGIYMLDSFVEISDADLKRIFEINLFGACTVNKTFLPLLKRGSRIVMTTSELAPLDPLPFTGIYAVTKAALDKYAYSLAMELQLLGIKVSVLRAGAVATDMLGVSTDALDRFCKDTKLYSCNAGRFKDIVNSVEARSILADKLAAKVLKIISSSDPRFVYSINRNPLLILLNALPERFQLWIIKQILK